MVEYYSFSFLICYTSGRFHATVNAFFCLGAASKSHWEPQEVSESVNRDCILFSIMSFPVKRLLNSKTWSSSLVKYILSCLLLVVPLDSLTFLISALHSSTAKFSSLTLPGWSMLNWCKLSCLSIYVFDLNVCSMFTHSQKLAYNILQGLNKSFSCLKKYMLSSSI